MELRKVGKELHLIGKHGIPLFIFGEGYIKRYGIRQLYSTYSIKVGETKLSEVIIDINNVLKCKDLSISLKDLYGEENGELVQDLVVYARGLWKEMNINYLNLPRGRKFETYTKDYISDHDLNQFEIINEKIEAETVNDTLVLDKFPLIFSVYKLGEEIPEGNPILSNETIDIYFDGDTVTTNIKSFPIEYYFECCGSKAELDYQFGSYHDCNYLRKRSLIQFLNECSLKEQLPVLLGGFKSLMRITNQICVPENEIVTRWSKYLGLSPFVRELLMKTRKDISYKFLKEYCGRGILSSYTREQNRLFLQLGKEPIERLFKCSHLVSSALDNIKKDNIKYIREITNRYVSPNLSPLIILIENTDNT